MNTVSLFRTEALGLMKLQLKTYSATNYLSDLGQVS